MKPLELLKKHRVPLPFNLGQRLGYGQDGQVFVKKFARKRVIKLSTNQEGFAVLSFLQSKGFSHIVPILKFNILLNNATDWVHFVEMERLFPLSEEEQKAMHTLLSHEDANKRKEFNPQALHDLSQWLSFDERKMRDFCLAVTSGPIRHLDLHPRNIMRDRNGYYRLIDLDRLEIV